MRKLMLAASAAALLAGITVANATDVTGTIKSIDPTKGMITLDDGKEFLLAPSIKPTEWKVGEKVKVTYDEKNGKMTVTALSKA